MFSKQVIVQFGATAAMIAASFSVVHAQEVTTPPEAAGVVSCLLEPAKLEQTEIDAFLASPMTLLTDAASGSAANSISLASRVRALAASSSATVDPILGLVSSASDTQIAAIGAGLSRAAQSCVGVEAEYAALIQSKVAGIDNATLLAAFAGGTDDVQTAAVSAGGAAAGPGAGASGIGAGGEAGGGTAGLGGDEGTPQTSENLQSVPSRNYFSDDVSTDFNAVDEVPSPVVP